MRRSRKLSILTTSIVLGLVCGSAVAQEADTSGLPFAEQDLVGTFATVGCDNVALGEDGQISNIRRYYNWDLTNYSVSYTWFADEACAEPLFTFFFAGPYRLGAPRPELGPVREAQIVFDTVTMTAESDAGAAVLREGCGSHPWSTSMTRDVGPHACLIKAPRADCIGDFELLMLDGDRLAPGVRTLDMCTPDGRPSAVQAVPAIRVTR